MPPPRSGRKLYGAFETGLIFPWRKREKKEQKRRLFGVEQTTTAYYVSFSIQLFLLIAISNGPTQSKYALIVPIDVSSCTKNGSEEEKTKPNENFTCTFDKLNDDNWADAANTGNGPNNELASQIQLIFSVIQYIFDRCTHRQRNEKRPAISPPIECEKFPWQKWILNRRSDENSKAYM